MRRLSSIVLVLVVLSARASAAPTPAQLRTERQAAAVKAMQLARTLFEAGRGTLDTVYAWSVRSLDAELALATTPKARAAAFADHAARMDDLAKAAQQKFTAGTADTSAVAGAAYFVAEARLWAAVGKRE